MLDAPSEPVVDHMVAAFSRSPSSMNSFILEHIHGALEPSLRRGGYVTYLGVEEDGDSREAAYSANLARLLEIKRTYDPASVFRM